MKPFWTKEKILRLELLKGSHTNNEMAEILETTERHIIYSMNYFGVKRTDEEIKNIQSEALSKQNRTRLGPKNSSWKGGISKDNYHYRKLQVQRYPERIKARRKVHNAIRSKKLIRGKCSYCGTGQNVCAHITDYKKPLTSIIWACRPCNRREHHSGRY